MTQERPKVLDFETSLMLFNSNIKMETDYMYCPEIRNPETGEPFLLKTLGLTLLLNSMDINNVKRIPAPYLTDYLSLINEKRPVF